MLVQDAILIVETASNAIAADWGSALFDTMIVEMVLLHDVRAHEDGAVALVEGVYTKPKELGLATLTKLEEACKAAASVLLLPDPNPAIGERGLDKAHADGTLASRVTLLCTRDDIESLLRNHVGDVDQLINAKEVKYSWSINSARALMKLVPMWSRDDASIYEDFCRWC